MTTDISNINIHQAVAQWVDDETAAIVAYGQIENRDVSNVSDMSGLFKNASGFNDDISRWDTSNVGDMSEMFMGASQFNQNIMWWDVSSVTNMSGMFEDASDFLQNISGGIWKAGYYYVTDYTNMFLNAIGMIAAGAPETPTNNYFKLMLPFCAEHAVEIKTDQGIYNIEDLDSSHTINGLKAIHYLKTKQLITLIKHRGNLFNIGSC